MTRIKDTYLFFLLYILFLSLILTNFIGHFPNDGVRYVSDAIILKDLLLNEFSEKSFYYYFPDENVPVQNGITVILSFLFILFAEYWTFFYCLLITFLNFFLIKKLIKILKKFQFNNSLIFVFLILLLFNFEYLKVSKSFYNEAIYLPILYYFNILVFEILYFKKKIKNFDLIFFFIFIFLGIFFRLNHIIFFVVFFLLFLKRYLNYKLVFIFSLILIVTLATILILNDEKIALRILTINSKLIEKLYIFIFPFNFHLIKDSQLLLSGLIEREGNLYINYFGATFILISFLFFFKSLKSFKNNKYFLFYNIYTVLFTYLFISFIHYDDERYFLFSNFNIIFFLLYNFRKKDLLSSISLPHFLLPIIFILTTVIFLNHNKNYLQNNNTFKTIDLINKNISTLIRPNQFKKYINKIYDNNTKLSYYRGEYPFNINYKKKIYCEIPRICFWEFFKKDNYVPIHSIKTINSYKNLDKDTEIFYVGSLDYLRKELIKIDFIILAKQGNIVLCKILKK